MADISKIKTPDGTTYDIKAKSLTEVLPISMGGTGKTTALEAIDALGGINNRNNYEGGTEIPENADLDDYTTPGTYYSPRSARTATIANAPLSGVGFKLFIIGAYSGKYVKQLAMGTDESVLIRSWNSSSWTPWIPITSGAPNFYGVCSTAAGTADKIAIAKHAHDGFKLVTGAVVWVRFTVTNSAAVANLTLNVNSTGAKHIKYRNGNLISAGFLHANCTYPFVYDGTYWQLSCDLDTNDTAHVVKTYSNSAKCGSKAIVAGNIIVAGTDGLYKHLKLGTAFDTAYPIFRAGSAISANAWGANNQVYSAATLQTTQSITLTQGKPVYIKGHLNGTVFTPISTSPLTRTVPTSADGCQYIYLGVAYSSTGMWLDANHPIYQFRDGKFALYEELSNDTLDIQKKQYIQQLKDLCLFAEMANGN